MGWEEEFEKEKRIQRQFDEWAKREEEKSQRAAARGDFDAARKFTERAKGYNEKASKSIDRQSEIVPLPKKGSGCLALLTLALLYSLIAQLRGTSRR